MNFIVRNSARLFIVVFSLTLGWLSISAQDRVGIGEAVELAGRNEPATRVAEARTGAARTNVEIPSTAFIPRLDLLIQANRATANNVTGLLFPQGIVPPISGPPLPVTGTSVWGTAGGLLFSWEPFDFGARRAAVNVAKAEANETAEREKVTRFEAQVAAADAFLATLASEQGVRVAQINVSRLETFVSVVRVATENGLKPGIDLVRARSELTQARIVLVKAEESAELARGSLASAIGAPDAPVLPDSGRLLDLPPEIPLPPTDFNLHPRTLAQGAAVDVVRARQHALDRIYVPRFSYQFALSGRGTGITNDNRFRQGATGLIPTTGNWATGVTVTFGVLDFFGIRAKRRFEQKQEAVETSRLDQTKQVLAALNRRAVTLVDHARDVARETPKLVSDAREAEMLARVRYEYGLSNVEEVLQLQRDLANAEYADSLARLGVWRALLARARARGDLSDFLQLAK
jgi:outer membrane protein TolC